MRLEPKSETLTISFLSQPNMPDPYEAKKGTQQRYESANRFKIMPEPKTSVCERKDTSKHHAGSNCMITDH
jgi:hypothetical protein